MTTPQSTRAREIPQLTPAEIDRFWARIDRSAGPDGCWPWDNPTPRGYGRVEFRQVPYSSHRIAYTLVNGPIPADFDIDHVKAKGCTSRACCNPKHLEAVPHKINVLRGDSPSAIHSRMTHCKHGHPFDETNTRHDADGRRRCRACHRATSIAYYQRQLVKREVS